MNSICVFCGSSFGDRPDYRQAAEQLGKLLAERGFHLIYGGGGVGLMGVVADTALYYGGQVTGIITQGLVDNEAQNPQVWRVCGRKPLLLKRNPHPRLFYWRG